MADQVVYHRRKSAAQYIKNKYERLGVAMANLDVEVLP